MLHAARTAVEIVGSRSLAEYRQDAVRQLAVERAIQIVGEAARRVSPDTPAAHPAIPWRNIIAQRHVIVHEYADLRPELLYEGATRDLPALIAALERLVPPERP